MVNLRLWPVMSRLRGTGAGLYYLLAGLLALGAAVAASLYLRSGVPTEAVWTAARSLPPGNVLTKADLKLKIVPIRGVPSGALRSADQVVGRRLGLGLIPDDIIRQGHLIAAGSDLPGRVAAAGMYFRAMLLPADVVPIAARLAPGDRLELTSVLPLRNQDLNTEIAVQVTAATVLEILSGPNDEGAAILILLESAAVPRVALALHAGTVTAAIMPAGLEGNADTTRLTLTELVGLAEKFPAEGAEP